MALEFRAISINLIAEDKSEKTPNLNWQVRSADALLVRKSVDRGPGEIEDARVFQSFFMKSILTQVNFLFHRGVENSLSGELTAMI